MFKILTQTNEVDNIMTLLDVSSMLNLIYNNGTNIVDILNTRYTKAEVYIYLYQLLIIKQKLVIC